MLRAASISTAFHECNSVFRASPSFEHPELVSERVRPRILQGHSRQSAYAEWRISVALNVANRRLPTNWQLRALLSGHH
jgi:hypothetical protein